MKHDIKNQDVPIENASAPFYRFAQYPQIMSNRLNRTRSHKRFILDLYTLRILSS